MVDMATLRRNARIAGLLYLALTLVGPIRLVVIPNMLLGSHNAAVTAHNIATHEMLIRVGIFSDLMAATIDIFLALALFRVFAGVDRPLAVMMALLGFMSTPIYFVNTLNDWGALLFARGTNFVAAFSVAQREAMTMLFVSLHHYGIVANEIFWGLWLVPLGILVYKSGFIPRFLGIWLVVNCLPYLALNVSGVFAPQYADVIENISFPVQLGEVAFMLWLVIMGARTSPVATAPA